MKLVLIACTLSPYLHVKDDWPELRLLTIAWDEFAWWFCFEQQINKQGEREMFSVSPYPRMQSKRFGPKGCSSPGNWTLAKVAGAPH